MTTENQARQPYSGPDADGDAEPNVAVRPTELDLELQRQADNTARGLPPQSAADPYEKRYKDLQSYMSKEQNRAKAELSKLTDAVTQLQSQLELQKKTTGGFVPTTEEELRAWSEANPQAYAIVRTVAGKELQDKITGLEQKIEVLTGSYESDKVELGMKALKALHPDFDELSVSPEFHAWVEEQPEEISNILYNSFDVKKTDWVISKYKLESKITKVKAKPDNGLEAALDVRRPGAPSPELQKGYLFSESQIQKMSEREYDANEAAITKAGNEGRIMLDISQRASFRR